MSIIFFSYGRFEILGKCPKTPKMACFWVRLMDFSGVEKWISGFFRAIVVETRNTLFYTREQFPRPGERPSHFFYVQNAPY